MDRIGLPKGLFTTVSLDHDGTARLIASRGVDHVNFTGSVAAAGRSNAPRPGTFTTLGLELGGKDPAYVRPDADFDYAVEPISSMARSSIPANAAAASSASTCTNALYDRFVEAFADARRRATPRQSARRTNDAWPDGGDALRRCRARPHRRGARQGRAAR